MNPIEYEKFKTISDDWWDENGVMKPLHAINKFRIPVIIDGLKSIGMIKQEADNERPLEGLEILDVGCGTGLFSESLARLGASVVGVDGVEELIMQAKKHALLDKNLRKLSYIAKAAEELGDEHIGKYDVVVASEVLDHVSEKENFIKITTGYLKPGGLYMASTMSKTALATTFIIDVTEKILCFIPQGSHETHMFITPEETGKFLKKYDCTTIFVRGYYYDYFKNVCFWINPTSIWYFLLAMKDK